MTLEGANNNSNANPIPFEKSILGLTFGIQVEFKRFGVDLHYESVSKETEASLNDIIYSAFGTNLTDIYAYKPSQISLSLNIFLFRTNGDDISDIFSNLFKGNSCDCLSN